MRPLCGPAARWWWPHRNHRRFRHAAPPPGKQKIAPGYSSPYRRKGCFPRVAVISVICRRKVKNIRVNTRLLPYQFFQYLITWHFKAEHQSGLFLMHCAVDCHLAV
nr:MAG TPA: hypothetical protein [Caudoviricetes sp.]